MQPKIRLWSVVNGKLVNVKESSFAEVRKEKDLEDWVEQNPSLLGVDLTVIGRQVFIPKVGPLDLLAVDATGNLVVIEFKRHQTTRDTIAQVIDYASSLRLMDRVILGNLPNMTSAALDSVTTFDPKMILVAAEADESVERIVEYLASKALLPIEVVTFTYAKLDDGREIIARQILSPEAPAPVAAARSPKISLSDLFSIAKERKVLEIATLLHRVATVLGWPDERFWNNGGTIRYWIDSPEGKGRVLFGMNIGGKRLDSPVGTLDVWVNVDIAAKYAGKTVESVSQSLSQYEIKNKTEKRVDIRIANESSAASLYSLLEMWDTMRSEARAALEAQQLDQDEV